MGFIEQSLPEDDSAIELANHQTSSQLKQLVVQSRLKSISLAFLLHVRQVALNVIET
jgi:hypothetical protein